MKESARKARNQTRLAELYPTFRTRVAHVIEALEAANLRPRIQDAWRSPADQKKAFDAGHSKLLFGFHNVTAKDGTPEALAVDLLDDDHPLDPPSRYILQLAAAAENAGLATGARWGLPKKLAAAVDEAIAAQAWDAKLKLGWDPTHVEPHGFTVAQARSNQRPT